MRKRTILFLLFFVSISVAEAAACAVCFGDRRSETAQHMATAVWFMLAFVMVVLGGIGAFSFHLWRHSRMPLEPHQELVEEDLEPYE